jgi:hypothetical protein
MGWTVAVGMITSLPFLVNIKINFFLEHLICSQISDRKFSVLVSVRDPNIALCMRQNNYGKKN